VNNTKWIALIVTILATFLLLVRSDSSEVETSHLDNGAVILAFGDSLTYGYGAVAQAYPKELQTMIGREVINAGVSGEVSATGLKRLPKLLEKYHPSLVILCHGGNDILRRYSKETLKENLNQMIVLSRASGAQVLLVGVPGFGLFGLSTVPLYEELALETNVLYEGSILEKIESEPTLKSDRIHPNSIGYRMMAEAFAKLLKENGLIE